MLLYHYTKFERFQEIWKSKALNFNVQTNTNDIFERNKIIIADTCFSKRNGLDTNSVISQIFTEIRKYKQVSFCKDYPDGTKGYASPMMWGQYARSKNKDNIWEDGVCLELDSSKIIIPSNHYLQGEIMYTKELDNIHLSSIDFTKNNVITDLIYSNKDLLFFSKHKHWEHESEYRFLSKYDEVMNISNAIMGIYVLDRESNTFIKVKDLVGDPSLIYFMIKGGNTWSLSRYNYKKYLLNFQ